MRIPKKLLFSSFIILFGTGQAWAEGSIRQQIIDSGMASALYSVDAHTTVFKTDMDKDTETALAGLCASNSGSFTSSGGYFSCAGVFEASSIGQASASATYLLKTADAQPLAYVTASIPSPDKVTQPPAGKITGELTSVEVYQMAYALCDKEQGTPAFVISKRFGKVARYVEVGAEEAFSYLLESGDGKDAWFMACEGQTRFMVEKDYRYDMTAASSFYFHQRRGLEWVDYVKADNGKLARLEAR